MKANERILLGLFLLLLCQCTESGRSTRSLAHKTSLDGQPAQVSELKITTLSTMLANRGIGEWGYAALVEADGRQILFDTGRRPETVLQNAAELGIDLSIVEDVFLSHNHGDHTGGLLTLRERLKQQNPKAMSNIHVAAGIFDQRINFPNRMLEMKKTLEADGVTFTVYEEEAELFPGVWITGPIARIHPEKNYGGKWEIATENGSVIDNIPEDQSLAIHTSKGFVLVAGCGHAGIINTLEQVTANIHDSPTFAIIGGFHLVTATDEHLAWTAEHLQGFGVSKIIGAHCTGINSLYALKELLSLSREDAVVGSVGDNFDLETGIHPGIIAK